MEHEGIYVNTSGKVIQNPLRLSPDFAWCINERIKILDEATVHQVQGYTVLNLDYVGNERCFETSWISKTLLTENFTKQSLPNS